MNESKADIKTIIDVEMEKILKDEDNLEKYSEQSSIIKEFYDACLSNPSFRKGLLNAMMDSAKKMAGIMMMEPESEEDAEKFVSTIGTAKPILVMVYLGYLFGKAEAGTQSLEEMFRKEMVN